MRRGPLALGFATEVAIAVAKTLENAHNLRVAIDGKEFRGVVHGDIKPKNIRIDARGEVRVLDFGIAKALSLSRRLTRNEFGSVPYASPERLDFGEVECRLRPLVAGRHALRDGHRHAAVSRREHRAAGAHDPLAHRAAAGARPLSRTAAPHPDQGDGAESRAALPIGARVRRRPRSLPRRRAGGRGERRPRRHAPHLPPARRCGGRRDTAHRRAAPDAAEATRRTSAPRRAADSTRQTKVADPVQALPPSASPCGSLLVSVRWPESCSAPGS